MGTTHARAPLSRTRRYDAALPARALAQQELIPTQVSPPQHGPRLPRAQTRTADVIHARPRSHKHANASFKHTCLTSKRERQRARRDLITT